MKQLLLRSAIPVQSHIRSDPTVINLAKRRSERHTAAKDQLITDNLAQEIHRLAHDLPSRLILCRQHADRIQKIQFDQIKAPHIKHLMKDLAQIFPHLFVRQIQRIKSTPVASTAKWLSIDIPHQPVRMFAEAPRLLLTHKRRQPQSRFHTVFMDLIHDRFKTIRELILLHIQPVPHIRLISIIDLKHIKTLSHFMDMLQII